MSPVQSVDIICDSTCDTADAESCAGPFFTLFGEICGKNAIVQFVVGW